MEKELEILNHIQENENITQREIAERTGLSLGAVNLLLKKMMKTGLIKIERLNARTLRYILTPEGLKEKTAKTYRYIVNSYHTIIKMQAVIRIVMEKQKQKGIHTIYLYGPENEVYQVLHMVLRELAHGLDMQYIKIDYIEEMEVRENQAVFIWDIEDEKKVKDKKITYINILSNL